MLQKLSIKNYAIIHHVEIDFHPQLTVITGETGAGKSIILGALSLLLGERADTSVLIHKDEKCVIEGYFDIRNIDAAKEILVSQDFDDASTTIIRREINTSGKSRAFINDTPATLQQLQMLGSHLVDLNRQFDNQLLHQASYQYALIDVLAENKNLFNLYTDLYKSYNNQLVKLDQLKENAATGQAAFEYNKFLYDELEQLQIRPDEFETLESQLAKAAHIELIQSTRTNAVYNLSESDDNQISKLKSTINALQQIVTFQPEVQPIVDRLQSVLEELKDISYELADNQSDESFTSGDLDEMQSRLDIGFRLMKKHQVDNTAALIEKMDALEMSMSQYLNVDKELEIIENEINVLKNKLQNVAKQLYEKRLSIIPSFEADVAERLSLIGMPNASIKVSLEYLDTLNSYGSDTLQLLMDANNTGKYLPISKVASGGEMSRILLTIKSLISNKLSLGTLIFDEVDAAISGEAAKQVAILIQQLAANQQTIVLTHQAQMAARGNEHLFIYKSPDETGRMTTNVELLSGEQRVIKIAQMIDGNDPGEAAIESVKSMLA